MGLNSAEPLVGRRLKRPTVVGVRHFDQGFGPRMELAQGYLAVLRQAVSKPHDGPKHGKTGDPRKHAALI